MQNVISVIGAFIIGTVVAAGPIDADIPIRNNPSIASCSQISCKRGLNITKPGQKQTKSIVKKVETIIAPSEVDSLINKYASDYAVDPNLMKKIARCESHFNPNAANGQYKGMYQYGNSTWVSTRKQMGLDTDIDLRYNAEEAIKTTAFKISRGGKMAWKDCL
jgi:hypothetical protein